MFDATQRNLLKRFVYTLYTVRANTGDGTVFNRLQLLHMLM